jgi:hypothetical protein
LASLAEKAEAFRVAMVESVPNLPMDKLRALESALAKVQRMDEPDPAAHVDGLEATIERQAQTIDMLSAADRVHAGVGRARERRLAELKERNAELVAWLESFLALEDCSSARALIAKNKRAAETAAMAEHAPTTSEFMP